MQRIGRGSTLALGFTGFGLKKRGASLGGKP